MISLAKFFMINYQLPGKMELKIILAMYLLFISNKYFPKNNMIDFFEISFLFINIW